MRLRHVVLGAMLVAPAQAQPPSRVVTGIVFDSIARRPLAGAVVQVMSVAASRPAATPESSPQVFSGNTDSAGRYRIAGLPAGQFAIGFQHDVLNALGLDSPLRAFELSADSSAAVDLAIPAGPAVRASLCGPDVRLEGEGVVAGYVLDARQGGMLIGAIVRVRWLELALEKQNYRTVTRSVTAVVGDDGRYVACGVTSDDAVALDVTMPGFRALNHRITIPSNGAVRQDYHLADSGVVRGSGKFTGHVRLADGTALRAGHAVVEALAIDVPIQDGEFALTGLPPGSWVLEARAIGYEPQSALIEIGEREVGSANITLTERAQVLDAVTVFGKPGGVAKILSAIESRRRAAVGSVFLRGDEWLESALDPADVVRGAAGFRYVSADVVLSSGCSFKYPPDDKPRFDGGKVQARERTLAVYLNGARVVGGLPELTTAVTMRDVVAVEAYQDVATAPTEWRTFDACAVLAVWTKY